ncbi:MAG: nucleotidyl transferase AbiEii/AbiGii toxin family protein [Burkholderiales bacterium]
MSEKNADQIQPLSRLGRQIAEAAASLEAMGTRFALIGGLALAVHDVIRATQDIDFLVEAENADAIDAELIRLGYHCVHRSSDAANYTRGSERLDLLYASRPVARRLLANAARFQTSLGNLQVVSTEGLIGFKLQALVNDALRTQDLEDIRMLLRTHHASMDMLEVREYFRLFDREKMLDEILREIGSAT